MKIFFRIVISCLLPGQLWAQADTLVLSPHKSIAFSEIALISTDNLQKIIVADKNGSITALTYDGEISNRYAFGKLADIGSLDASLSFNLLIFYKDLQQCIFADRLLRPISEISLPYNYDLAANAHNGDLWLFSEDKYSVDQYSPILQQNILEIQLKAYLHNETVVSIKEYNHLLAITTHQTIYFFSLTGKLQHKIPIPKNAASHLSQGNIWVMHEGVLQKQALYKNENTFFKLEVPAPIKSFVIPENRNLLVLNAGERLFFVKLPVSTVE